MSSNHDFKCGKCKIAINVFADKQGNKRGVCPRCGNENTVENITKIIGQYVLEKTASVMHTTLKKATQGSRVMKLTSSAPAKGNHRFIV